MGEKNPGLDRSVSTLCSVQVLFVLTSNLPSAPSPSWWPLLFSSGILALCLPFLHQSLLPEKLGQIPAHKA